MSHAMTSPAHPLVWPIESLRQALEPLLPGIGVEVVAETTSTNTVLLERARPRPVDVEGDGVLLRRSVESAAFGRAVDLRPRLLVAEHQTGGRGRLGRPWQSAAGASLTFSLALPLHRNDLAGLSLAVGVALCEALDTDMLAAKPRLGLKWPNDLWLSDAAGSGRKLGGILIETISAGASRQLVIGVGLNVLPLADDGHGAADSSRHFGSGFAWLRELDAAASAPAALQRIAVPLVQAVVSFEQHGFAAFAERFAARDLLSGVVVTTSDGRAPSGIARGVAADGALQLETADGVRSVSSGEVSVRPAGVAAAPLPTTC